MAFSKAAPYKQTYLRTSIMLLLGGVFMSTLFILLYRLWQGGLGYTIGETLMNYHFGFYRRALIGNLFLLVQHKTTLLVLIALAYSFCLVSPFLLIRGELKSRSQEWILLGILLILLSPFGVIFYLKETGAIKKELFFYPIFFLVIYWRSRNNKLTNGLVAAFIVISLLIHESFFFLFLPFLLCYLWLNKWGSLKWLALHLCIAVVTTLLLSIAQGNSACITDNFVQEYVNLGFQKNMFVHFEYYQKLTSAQNIKLSFYHFAGVTPFIYFTLYISQFYLLYFLFGYFGGIVQFNKPKALLLSLGLILLMVFLLCFIAMDYGRWLAVAFTTSTILIASQIDTITFNGIQRPLLQRITFCLSAICWGLFARIPCYAANIWIETSDWVCLSDVFR